MAKVARKIYDIAEIPDSDALPERFMFPFSTLNFLLNGGIFDRVTLIAARSNEGKTTLTSQIIEYIVEQGYKCCCALLEDTAWESKDRFYKQYLKSNVKAVKYVPYQQNGKDTNCGEFILEEEYRQKAKEKFAGKIFLYNTRANADIDNILDGFEEARVNYGCRVFVVDNAENLDTMDMENENKALKDSVIKIRDYAINNKVHIFLISHIRKMERDVILPTMSDVKGSSSLTNIAKNVVILLRTDKLDKNSKGYKTLAKIVDQHGIQLDECDSLLYVDKTKGRKLGYVGLKYNPVTNTFYEFKQSQKVDDVAKAMFEKPVLTPPVNYNIDTSGYEDLPADGELPF